MFKPDIYVDNIFEIDLEYLKKKGIKGLFFDIDNTLEPYATPKPSSKTIDFFNNLIQKGFKVGIISNARLVRAELFCENLNIDYVGKAQKPSKRGYDLLSKKMGIKKNEAAMIGDQLFTDIWGGKSNGCLTILVQPIEGKEPFFVKFKRYLEKPFWPKNKGGM